MDTNAFQRWNTDLANIIAHVGGPIFSSRYSPPLRHIGGLSTGVVYHRDLPPKLLDHKIPKEAYGPQVDEYLEGPYREDPFFKVSLNSPRNNCYRLSRLVTGDFEDSYHQTTTPARAP